MVQKQEATQAKRGSTLQANGGGSAEGIIINSNNTTVSPFPPVICPVPSPPLPSKKSEADSSALERAAPEDNRPPKSSSKKRRRRPLAFDAIAFFINSTPQGRRYFGENFQVENLFAAVWEVLYRWASKV
jgi:hypothetical protein